MRKCVSLKLKKSDLTKKFKQKLYINPLENAFKNGKQTLVFQQKS